MSELRPTKQLAGSPKLPGEVPYMRAVAALKYIATGDGYYGAQAKEYKDLARSTLIVLGEVWP